MSLTLSQYAEAKGLDAKDLAAWGLTEHKDGRGAYVRIPYFDESGNEVAIRQRLSLDGPNRFRWRTGAKPCLYGLDQLGHARAQGYVVIVEGESDCHTLRQAGAPALGLPGASLWNEARDAAKLDGIEKIFVVHEADSGGEAVLEWLAKSAIRHRAHVVSLSPEAKDPSALYLQDRAKFAYVFAAKLAAATPWATIEAARTSAVAKDAYETARDLAHTSDILGAFRAGLKTAGLVGEDKNASVLYLALTSRLTKKPVSVAYKGPSSGGKSFAVERVLAHFPDSAVVMLTSMSERALIYMDDDIAHNTWSSPRPTAPPARCRTISCARC